MKGSLFMAFAMAGFTCNDAIMKVLSATLPVPQTIFLRGVIATSLIALLVAVSRSKSLRRDLRRPVIWWRAGMELGATYTFLTALKHMPIANAAAILSALPLAVTIGSAVFFKEPVGWRRWLAILIGFSGVVLIVRPGLEGFNAYSVLALVCVVFAAARDLITRRAPADIPSLTFTLSTSLAITLSGALYVAVSGHFTPVGTKEISFLFASSFLLVFGYFFIVSAMRIGEISVVAPFRYTGLIWAIFIGMIVFDDPLDWFTVAGSAIVVATGVYTLYRERALALNRDRERRVPQAR